MDYLRALLSSTSKLLVSCGLTIKGKSSFNISGLYPKNNSLLLLMEIMFLLLDLATSNFTPFYPYTIFFMNLQQGGQLELLKSRKLGQLLKFDFTINVLDIHRLSYLRQCFHIYLQKSLSSPLSVMFASFQTFWPHSF
ncbi:hypothetical protein CR513_09638, partial [Mucuna pruriens]